MSASPFPALALLASAPSQQWLDDALCRSWALRKVAKPSGHLHWLAEGLKLTDDAAAQPVFAAVVTMVRAWVSHMWTAEQGAAWFPAADFHAKLRDMLCAICAQRLQQWAAISVLTQISLPKLRNIDWRVNVKSASNAISAMAVPTCFVQLLVESNGASPTTTAPDATASDAQGDQGLSKVTFELNRQTLSAMLEGLGRIRDQLDHLK